jgi:ADP-heptose:LPS heptosyltransferase
VRTLVARLDNLGDVLLAGPATRAVAAGSDHVTFLAGPSGAAAAALLPGVDEVLTFDAPWIGFDAAPVDAGATAALVERVAAGRFDAAVILTSFHQSPLPLALLLRLAGVPLLAATCVDFPGGLLDVRFPVLDGAHEVEQALALAAAAGFPLPPSDDGRLAVRRPLPRPAADLPARYVVVHAGASVPARGIHAGVAAGLVDRLLAGGSDVVLTGTLSEHRLAVRVAGRAGHPRAGVVDLTGRVAFAELAAVLDGADAVVCGNTGPAHLAAAVGTPVVEVFAPVVPVERWRPWGVPSVVLGDQEVPCA